jgi:hypothetical protein
MSRAWDPQKPVESLFKQIQDCADYSEAGGVIIGHPQQINVGNFFATEHFTRACRRWNEKPSIEKSWAHFKAHFAAAHRQHKQIQGESAATSGYHAAHAAVVQTEDQMAEETIGALDNLATDTAAGNIVLTLPHKITARLTVTRSPTLTPISASTFPSRGTSGKALGLTTWAAARPIKNDVQGRYI